MELDQLINRFRLASRNLRNHYFHPPDWDDDGWNVVERFEEVGRLLFENLVLCPAVLDLIDYGQPNPSIVVAPRRPGDVPIMINRDRGADSGYWDHPTKTIASSTAMMFVEFFDWDELAYRDHRYAHVVITAHPSLADLIGHHGLIESQYVRYARAGAV